MDDALDFDIDVELEGDFELAVDTAAEGEEGAGGAD